MTTCQKALSSLCQRNHSQSTSMNRRVQVGILILKTPLASSEYFAFLLTQFHAFDINNPALMIFFIERQGQEFLYPLLFEILEESLQ